MIGRAYMALQQAAADADGDSHVICIDGGSGGDVNHRPSPEPLDECAVCMERLEWVAVGECGHRAVCAGCAVRLRFARGDRRCCICRAYCHSVVVVSKAGDGGEAASQRTFKEELARLDAIGGEYWYHSGLKAYFDDEEQYEAAASACSGGGGDADPCDDAWCWCLRAAVLFMVFVACFLAGLTFS